MKKIVKAVIGLILYLGCLQLSHAQVFTELAGTNFTPVYLGNAIWGDIDNDNDLDLFATGWKTNGTSTSPPSSQLYLNNGNETFTPLNSTIAPAGASGAAFCDFNKDGFLDLTVCGNTGSNNYISKLYKNNGDNTFTEVAAGLPAVYSPTIAWADYDNDGDQDLLFGGSLSASTAIAKIFRNDGNAVFTDINANIGTLNNGTGAWGDYDNDGDLDLITSGKGEVSWNFVTTLYKNEGNDQFTAVDYPFLGVRYSSIIFGDYNNDGKADLLISGESSTGSASGGLHTVLYKNTGNDSFLELAVPFTGVSQGKNVFGDYDNDGDLDIIITGNTVATGAEFTTNIYQNNGNDQFTETEMFTIDGARRSSLAFGDYNNDGKLDIALTGWTSSGNYLAKIFKNNTTIANQTPTAPTTLTSTVTGHQAVINWNNGTDTTTPDSVLTYNFYLKKADSTAYSFTSLSNYETGFLRIPASGNMGVANSFLIDSLADGKYFYSIQAIDNSFAGSAFAPVDSFQVGGVSINQNNLKSITLLSNYPNPFNATTMITYQLSTSNPVSLRIYDLSGKLVDELVNANQQAGKYQVSYNGRELSSGTYFYQLKSGNECLNGKLLLCK